VEYQRCKLFRSLHTPTGMTLSIRILHGDEMEILQDHASGHGHTFLCQECWRAICLMPWTFVSTTRIFKADADEVLGIL